MRRLAAVVVVGIALVGAVYFNSLSLGGPGFRCGWVPSVGLGFPNGNPCHVGAPILTRSSHAAWQSPLSVIIGLLGVAGALVILRSRPKQPSSNAPQAA